VILLVDWGQYAENLEKIKAIKQTETIMDQAGGLEFPPEDEIALRHQLITPADALNLITKNLRIANLNPNEVIIARKAAILITWLESMKGSYPDLEKDKYMSELIEEILNDISILLNISVSKKGWLVDNILNPKKRFTLFGERAEKRGLIFNRGGEQQQ
jgi:hypothetical protein